MSGFKAFITSSIEQRIKEAAIALKSDMFTDEERLEFIEMLTDGICTDCGTVTEISCHCTNDE